MLFIDLVSLWLPGHHSTNSSTYPLLVRRSNKNYRCNRDTTQVNNLDFKQPRWCIVKLQAFIFRRQFGLKRWGRDAGVFYPKHRVRHLKLAWLIKSQTRADIPNTQTYCGSVERSVLWPTLQMMMGMLLSSWSKRGRNESTLLLQRLQFLCSCI